MTDAKQAIADLLTGITAEITEEVNELVMKKVASRLDDFCTKLAQVAGLDQEVIRKCWNDLNADIQLKPSSAGSPEKKSGTRSQTDKNRKCQKIKVSGPEVGQPCGKYCLVGNEYCSVHAAAHAKKMAAAGAPAATPSVVPSAAPSANGTVVATSVDTSRHAEIPASEELPKLTIAKLKELATTMGIRIASNLRKDQIMATLAAARDKALESQSS